MNVESKLQVSLIWGQRKVYAPDQQSVSTSEINNTTMLRDVMGHHCVYLTDRRTGANEANTYPTIRTRLLNALTGDSLKGDAKNGYSQQGLEYPSRLQSVRSSLSTQKSVHMAKGRTYHVLKSELLREEHLN